MQIVICDDEKEMRDLLADKVQEFCPEADILCYQSGEELLVLGRQPDILFLDIQMPGRSGMEIARELRKKNKRTILIFVTAIEEYVFQAFDVGAFHYLVKPFTNEKFISILQNAVEQYKNQPAVDFRSPSAEKEGRSMMIMSGGNHIKVKLDDIVYAEVFNRKVIIHKMGEDIEYYGKLSELQKLAGEDFFRPHRAYLIHLKYVIKYNASSITMENGTVLMSKANYPEFVQRFLKYNRRGKEI